MQRGILWDTLMQAVFLLRRYINASVVLLWGYINAVDLLWGYTNAGDILL